MTRERMGVVVAAWLATVALVSCAADDPDAEDSVSVTAITAPATIDDSGDSGADDDPGDDEGLDSMSGVDDDGVSVGDDAADSSGAGDDTSADDGTSDGGGDFDHGLCGEPVPAGSPVPPGPPAYSGGACPAFVPGYNVGFTAGGMSREFALIVPNAIDDTGTYPLVFAWYHISGNAMDFVNDIQAQALADAARAIIVIPQDTGMFETTWPDTPLDIDQSGVDLAMFDDLYACISQQFAINQNCVSSLGVSAGGLWTSYLGTVRGQHLASNLTISGGHPSEFVGPWWPWASARPFAALVMWGGPSDVLGIDFHAASLNLVGDYVGSSHYTLRCEHAGGHGVPPVGDGDPLQTALHFVRNHPFWLNGASPLDMGFPAYYPSYCSSV